MPYGEPLIELQRAFIQCMTPVIHSVPDSVTGLAKRIGMTETDLNEFLDGSRSLSDIEFTRLCSAIDCEYKYVEVDKSICHHAYTLRGHRTLFPKSLEHIQFLYDILTDHGDMTFSFEIVGTHGYRFTDCRFLFINCFGRYSLLCIEDSGVLEHLILKDRLNNYFGIRMACDELGDKITNHIEFVQSNPKEALAADNEFYGNKSLVFSQLATTYLTDDEEKVVDTLI